MTKFTRAAAAAAVLTAGLGSVGCVTTGHRGGGDDTAGDRYRNYVDPCYPERYNHAARQAVIAPFAQQVHNGHVLNQTVFTYYFEPGTDKLTSAGREKLDSIARTRPAPDPRLYIQAGTDLAQTDANAGQIVELRAELDAKRAAAIQKYLATVPTFVPVQYEVFVHNPATPGIASAAAAGAYTGSLQGYQGGISGAAGIGALSTGGGTNISVGPTVVGNGAAGGAASGGTAAGGTAGGSGGRTAAPR